MLQAMIGLRDIPQLAIFPVRMQRNLAQFGEFQWSVQGDGQF